MKNLLAIVLSAVLVLSFAAVSMAAITVTGEVNVGLTLAPEASKGQFSDAKVVFDAAINDTLSANVAIKGTNAGSTDNDGDTTGYNVVLDTYSISNKFDMGTLKLGYFGANLNGKKDILGVAIGEIKPAALIEFAANVGEGMKVAVDYDYQTTSNYIASFTYDVAPLWVQVGMSNQATVTGTALNVGYALGAFTPYLVYQTEGDDKTQLLGVLYTADALSARFEYNMVKDVNDNSPMGLKVAYTAENSLVYTLSYVKDAGATDATTQVKVTAKL